MARFDMPLDSCALPARRGEPADFDAFWARTLAESRAGRRAPSFEPVDTRSATVEIFDVTFAGYGGQPIKGWLRCRARRAAALRGRVHRLRRRARLCRRLAAVGRAGYAHW